MWVKLLQEWQSKGIGEVLKVSEDTATALISTKYAEKAPDPTAGIADGLVKVVSDQLSTHMTKAFSDAIAETTKRITELKQTGIQKVEDKAPVQKRLGPWLHAVFTKNYKYLEEHYPEQMLTFDNGNQTVPLFQKAALNTQTGTQGGYIVPTPFYPQLMQLATEMSVVRRFATVVPMGSRSVLIPTLDQTTAPTAGQTAFFGGVVATWTEEAATMTETEPTFKQIEMVAHELSGYSKASMALLQDNAVALESLLMQLFAGAVAWFEDYAFLRGDGVGKPLGVTNSNCKVSVSRATAGEFKLQDASKMLSRLLPGWNPRTTCWVIGPYVLEKLIQMGDSAGNIIWIPSARDNLPMTLFGLPVMTSEKLPALGTANDVMLCDFKHYLIGDRMQLEIAASEHYAFINNQITWRFVHRVDGQPWLRSAVTLSDATSTVSPFVLLS